MKTDKELAIIISRYLPYGVHAEMLDYKIDYVGKRYDKIIGLHQWDKSGELWSCITEGGSKPSVQRIRLLLNKERDSRILITYNVAELLNSKLVDYNCLIEDGYAIDISTVNLEQR